MELFPTNPGSDRGKLCTQLYRVLKISHTLTSISSEDGALVGTQYIYHTITHEPKKTSQVIYCIYLLESESQAFKAKNLK